MTTDLLFRVGPNDYFSARDWRAKRGRDYASGLRQFAMAGEAAADVEDEGEAECLKVVQALPYAP
ncbi:hypothetical protein [Paraburkholderia sp. J41]|uniref:hypothetical protein n=1 Tax=Paraburkholderia sp. J41 TaxID=2805433 RepID=UPI002AC35FA4|nr:hypothetical protein [Paraburkholderia sp. J41]